MTVSFIQLKFSVTPNGILHKVKWKYSHYWNTQVKQYDHHIKSLRHWCFWTVVLEKTLESPLDCKEIQLVHPKGDQSWIFIWRTDAEAEAPIFWPPDLKRWPTGKDPDAGRDWKYKEKRQQRMRWLDSIINSIDMNLSKLQEMMENRGDSGATVHRVSQSRTW